MYRSYLYTIMLVEAVPRGFDEAHRRWLEHGVVAPLVAELDGLSAAGRASRPRQRVRQLTERQASQPCGAAGRIVVTAWYPPGMGGWVEVADGVFQRRYDPYDVSVCVVRGDDGLLLVDTRTSPREADVILDDLRELGDLPLRWVVNTHAHFDHAFGNQRFGPGSRLGLPLFGHERMPAHLAEYEQPQLTEAIEQGEGPADVWREVVVTPPTELVRDRRTLDVGGRAVELVHLGRGHTDNDLLIHVPDAGAWLLGDLVEESGPPVYGIDSFPLDWPETVRALLARLTDDDVLVPGHGAVVARRFAAAQHAELNAVADIIRELHAAGVPADDALAAAKERWPFPADRLGAAVTRGYAQLNAEPH